MDLHVSPFNVFCFSLSATLFCLLVSFFIFFAFLASSMSSILIFLLDILFSLSNEADDAARLTGFDLSGGATDAMVANVCKGLEFRLVRFSIAGGGIGDDGTIFFCFLSKVFPKVR